MKNLVFSYVSTGWEYHSYLVQQRTSGVIIYEPTDNVVQQWKPGVHGITSVKAAYAVTVRPKGKGHGHVTVHQPVVLTNVLG